MNKRFLAYFGGILAVPRKKARFRPILAYFEAIFGLHLPPAGQQGSFGPKTGVPPPSRPPILDIFGGCPILRGSVLKGGLIQYLRGAYSVLKGGLIQYLRGGGLIQYF